MTKKRQTEHWIKVRVYLLHLLLPLCFISCCCPGRHDLVPVCLGIVNRKRIPGLELLLANNASVGEVEVYLSMPLYHCFVLHCLSTSLTLILQWPTIFYSCYHWLQQRIQVYKETYVIYNVRILWIIVEGNYSGWNINSQPTPSLQRKRESRIKFKHKKGYFANIKMKPPCLTQ